MVIFIPLHGEGGQGGDKNLVQTYREQRSHEKKYEYIEKEEIEREKYP